MTAMTFNTLDATRRLVAAGLDRPKAEAVVDEIAAAQWDLASKADLAATKADVEAAIHKSALDLTWRLIGAMIAINGFFAGLLFFALRK